MSDLASLTMISDDMAFRDQSMKLPYLLVFPLNYCGYYNHNNLSCGEIQSENKSMHEKFIIW